MRSGWISLAGVVCPCLLGMACSYGLYTYVLQETDGNVPIKSFILFVGVSMSIT
uniref:Uncharacterized protein n=1 Tax=Romanomermis culicivorax TaxID=13658 RepID=A0A915KJI2_ROMCU